MEKYKKYIIGLILLLVVCCGVLFYTTIHYKHQATVANLKLADTAHYFTQVRTEDGKLIAEQSQVIASQKDAIEAGLIDKEELKRLNLKNVKSIVKLNAEITKLHDTIAYLNGKPNVIHVDETKPDGTIVKKTYLEVPQKFKEKTEFYHVDGTVTENGVVLDTVQMKFKEKIFIADKKLGFFGIFKKPQPVVKVEFDNPDLILTEMANVVVDNRKWYNRKIVIFGTGFLTGFIFGTAIK